MAATCPLGTFAGTVKLICATPTDQLGMPTYDIAEAATAMPPTVTVTDWRGFGNCDADGAAPSARLGVIAPTPVTYTVLICPALAVRVGVTSFVPSGNM